MMADSATIDTGPDRRPLLLGLLLTLATCAVFGGILSAGFVRWDDGLHVYANPNLHPVTGDSLARLWRSPYQNLYVPLSYSLYAALASVAHLPHPTATSDGLVVDLDPRVFHAACLLLHLANVLLVFALLRRLLPRLGQSSASVADWAAGAGALLFAVHPVQVESVAWISEMRGLLAGLFSLLALLTYVRLDDDRRWYVLATLCFGLALLSKPSAVAVPLLAVCLETFVLKRPARVWRVGLAGWGLLALLFLALTHAAQPVTEDIVTPLWTRPFIAGDALAFYAGKLLWPARLGIDYGRSPVWLVAQPWFLLPGLLALAAALAVWLVRRRVPALAASTGLFVAALLPTLGLTPFTFQVYSTVADRYVYLALLGPALGLAWGLTRLAHLPRPAFRLASRTVCACGLALLGLCARTQTFAWHDSIALFTQALSVNPQSWGACNNLATVALDLGRPADALPLLGEAVRLRPHYAEAHANRGRALLVLGERAGAEAEFRAALQSKPDLPYAYTGLGASLLSEGRASEADAAFRQALALDPESPQARAGMRMAEAEVPTRHPQSP